jgi:hypothetical protein
MKQWYDGWGSAVYHVVVGAAEMVTGYDDSDEGGFLQGFEHFVHGFGLMGPTGYATSLQAHTNLIVPQSCIHIVMCLSRCYYVKSAVWHHIYFL